MKKYFVILVLFLFVSKTYAIPTKELPIDSSLFTIESTSGISNWSGNSITIDFSSTGPLFGGFVQTSLLSTSLLPANLVGISFDITSTLENARISFGINVYEGSGHGEGSVNLVNYANMTDSWDLTTFTRRQTGIDMATSDVVDSYLGAAYSPLSLITPIPLNDFPLFSLDFRADGYTGIGSEYLPGSVTFSNINWIVSKYPHHVPEPSSILLVSIALIELLFARKRKAV